MLCSTSQLVCRYLKHFIWCTVHLCLISFLISINIEHWLIMCLLGIHRIIPNIVELSHGLFFMLRSWQEICPVPVDGFPNKVDVFVWWGTGTPKCNPSSLNTISFLVVYCFVVDIYSFVHYICRSSFLSSTKRCVVLHHGDKTHLNYIGLFVCRKFQVFLYT